MILNRRDMLRLTGRGASGLALTAGLATLPWSLSTHRAEAQVDQQALLEAGPLGDHVLGAEDAPVTVVEYASMTCPHCARFHTATYPDLKTTYIDEGKARLIFREFPLDQRALAAAMLARCADESKFFPFIDILFEKQREWAPARDWDAQLLKLARFAGFSKDSFIACLKNVDVAQGVLAVKQKAAESFDVQSTPTFFVNGQMVRGNQPFSEFQKMIDPLLAG